MRMTAVRLAHFSDVHITAQRLGWKRTDWLTKRLPGWFHLRSLGRGHRFRSADQVLAALVAELRRRRPDHVVFSGDATALGFEAEFERAAAVLGMTEPDLLPGLAVPGNHDYYTRSVAASGLFERYFAPWQSGRRIDDAVYPFAQQVGHVWLVAVNSCTGNRWSWDAAGGVDAAQLSRLERLLATLEPGPRVLVTHYPLCLASGRPERRYHGLRDLAAFVSVAARGGVSAWLHGHRHGSYFLPRPAFAPFPVLCAGSATQHELWSYGEYTIDGYRLHGLRRTFDPQSATFSDRDSFEFDLRNHAAEQGP
jgi:3',5'-cyclic AMP phosphodiesterase CpdA